MRGYGEITLAVLKDGDKGQGIDSILEQFYLSASGTELVGGSWSDTPPEWTPNTYVWTRYKITYNNPTEIKYTDPVCNAFWDALDKVEQDIVHVQNTTTETSLKVDKLKQEIESKVSQEEIDQAIEGIRPDIDKANQGLNKWLIEIYDKESLPEDRREEVTFSAFFGSNTSPMIKKELEDSKLSNAIHAANHYIGYGLTFVKIKTSTKIKTTFSAYPVGTLYCNGKDVIPTENNEVELSFAEGWNVLEIIWNVEDDTAGGFVFGLALSEHEQCELMNCYYRTITGRETSLTNRFASAKITLDSIQTTVSETKSILTTKADGEVVQSLQEKLNESIATLDEFKRTVSNTYVTNDAMISVKTEIKQLADSISSIVTAEKVGEMIESQIQQHAGDWRIDFQENGATCGSFVVTPEGVTISGDKVDYKTYITSTEFSGWYKNTKVFWLNQDETVSERLRVEKGIDLRTIKFIPTEQNGYRGLDILGGNAIL